jgi:predicted 3-demethylubiquinone-9 3-methyltransferase (glyoxalase superfamily)
MASKISAQKITPNLWFSGNAEEAVNYYLSVFKDARIGRTSRYGKFGEEHGMTEGTVMTIEFTIEGQEFLALNGGPYFQFNEAVSFIVNCDTQEEIDYYWEKLTAGGDEKSRICGWLKDQFGVSWQVVPSALRDMIGDNDQRKANNVMAAILKMSKLDLKALEAAYAK